MQAHDDQLDDIAALALTDGNIIVGDGTNWRAENGATARASLGLEIGANVQAHSATLDATTATFLAGDKPPVLIEQLTASASSSLDFSTGIDSTYDHYLFLLSNILPASDGVHLQARVSEDGGSTWKSGASDYEGNAVALRSDTAGVSNATNYQANGQITFQLFQGSAAGEGANGRIWMPAPAASAVHHLIGDLNFMDNTATAVMVRSIFGGVYNGTTNAINGLQFFFSSGNIASGTISLYGWKD